MANTRQQQYKEYPIGTISSGTLRREDLISSFADELRRLVKQKGVGREQRKRHLTLCREVARNQRAKDYYKSDDASFDLDALFDSLNEYAGPYFYFGAHPGDGADFGFWLSESFDEDFDGLKVSDLSEVPAKYTGEVALVNDHGNLTLYVKSARKLRELWAIV